MTIFSGSVEAQGIATLRPYAGNARTHSKQQVKQIAQSIKRFGFTNPVLISDDGEIIAGHGRVEAAKLLSMTKVPTIRLSHLSGAERRAYVLADNKLALNAGWDTEILAIELQALVDIDFDMADTGFSVTEIDQVLDAAACANTKAREDKNDVVPAVGATAVTRMGDLWHLGRHRLICGDAQDSDCFTSLLADQDAALLFADCPFNVPIDGHVSGLGKHRHREFALAKVAVPPRGDDGARGWVERDLVVAGLGAARSRLDAEQRRLVGFAGKIHAVDREPRTARAAASRSANGSSGVRPAAAAGSANSDGANTRSSSSFHAMVAPVSPTMTRNSAGPSPT